MIFFNFLLTYIHTCIHHMCVLLYEYCSPLGRTKYGITIYFYDIQTRGTGVVRIYTCMCVIVYVSLIICPLCGWIYSYNVFDRQHYFVLYQLHLKNYKLNVDDFSLAFAYTCESTMLTFKYIHIGNYLYVQSTLQLTIYYKRLHYSV